MKTKSNFVVVLFVAVATLLATASMTAMGVLYYNDIYSPWQDFDVQREFPVAEQDLINEAVDDMLDKTFTVNFSEAESDGFTFDIKDYAKPVVSIEQTSFKQWLLGEPVILNKSWEFNEDKLVNKLNEYYVKNKNAKLKLNKENDIVLVNDKSWHEFDSQQVATYIESLIEQNTYIAYLYKDDVNYTYPANVLTKDLQSKYNNCKWLNDFRISYTSRKELDKNFFSKYYTKDFDIDLDKLDLEEFLNELEDYYDTAGITTDFTTTSGDVIDIVYVTLGSHVWRDKETEFIKECIKNKKSETFRAPEYYGVPVVGDTYIEVSIDKQHLWHYVDGELCCESDVVTGRANGRDTPKGAYYVTEKIPGKYLVGDDYKTWVNRWMRLTNSGVGLHDAGWRGSFGGTIYKYSGSHGCINLPKSFAYKLYDEIENRIPVVIY